MDSRILFPDQPIQPISSGPKTPVKSQTRTGAGDFKQILDEKLQPQLKLSSHAQERLRSRGITLSQEDMDMLSQAVDKARAKGSKDSLVLMKDMAFVVSVKNNTVITAVDSDSLKENIFTNIDSAVIM